MKFSISVLIATLALASANERVLKEDHKQKAGIEALKAHNQRRIARLEQMIDERRKLKEDHETGRRRLSSDEYELASRQYKNFQRKLEQLKKRDTIEDHLERLEELKTLRNLNRFDYVDVKDLN